MKFHRIYSFHIFRFSWRFYITRVSRANSQILPGILYRNGSLCILVWQMLFYVLTNLFPTNKGRRFYWIRSYVQIPVHLKTNVWNLPSIKHRIVFAKLIRLYWNRVTSTSTIPCICFWYCYWCLAKHVACQLSPKVKIISSDTPVRLRYFATLSDFGHTRQLLIAIAEAQ